MKIVKVILLTGLVISALPTFTHTHEELKAELAIEKQKNQTLKEALEEANKRITAQNEINSHIIEQAKNSWGWKKKAGTFVAGVFIGWLVSAQGGQQGNNRMPGARTTKM